MNFVSDNTDLDEVLLIQPMIFKDERGYFSENFNLNDFQGLIGDKQISFVQDNYSHSKKGVIRGLHYQIENPQGKLVSVLNGKVYDVVVDIRKSSDNFGKWIGVELSSENRNQLWVPKGFAHGFLVQSNTADVFYKVTDYYSPNSERCIIWNDDELNIKWPKENNYIVSKKDSSGISLRDAEVFN